MTKKELQLILEEGEGYLIEFKERLTHLDREMVAFANGAGGRIFLGVADTCEVQGIRITNSLKSQIQDMANNCDPPVRIRMETHANILIVHVSPGDDKPYSCSSGFYLRIGPNAQKMKRNQVLAFFQSEGKIRYDELTNTKFTYESHFDDTKLDRFLAQAGISRVMDSVDILHNLGVVEKQAGRVLFNNAGIVMFARNLDHHYRHTVVTCALYKGTEKVTVLDRKDFNSDLVTNVDNAMVFLKQHLRLRYEFDGSPRRIEIPEIPYEALREAVINAVIHRDYFEKGANVMVEIFDDRIEISSPGALVKGLSQADFGKKSMLRNPGIANLFHHMGYIEKMGTGIKRMQNLMAEANQAPIVFEFTGFVTARFSRIISDAPLRTREKTREKTRGKTRENILALIATDPSISMEGLAEKVGLTVKGIEWQIRQLKQAGKLKRIGPAKGGHWEIQ